MDLHRIVRQRFRCHMNAAFHSSVKATATVSRLFCPVTVNHRLYCDKQLLWANRTLMSLLSNCDSDGWRLERIPHSKFQCCYLLFVAVTVARNCNQAHCSVETKWLRFTVRYLRLDLLIDDFEDIIWSKSGWFNGTGCTGSTFFTFIFLIGPGLYRRWRIYIIISTVFQVPKEHPMQNSLVCVI